jgi:hypothetical protein
MSHANIFKIYCGGSKLRLSRSNLRAMVLSSEVKLNSSNKTTSASQQQGESLSINKVKESSSGVTKSALPINNAADTIQQNNRQDALEVNVIPGSKADKNALEATKSPESPSLDVKIPDLCTTIH